MYRVYKSFPGMKGFTCKTGDLNLIVGAADYEGRVEICNRNAWGTICDDSWDDVDATVVCIQLGLTSTCKF